MNTKNIKLKLLFILFIFFKPLLEAQTVFKVGKKDTLFQEISAQKKFTIRLKSTIYPIRLNTIHNWQIHLETADTKVVDNAHIQILGGMPEHGHGFPTTPSVSAYLGNGNYRVEGIKFNMYGLWVMEFLIASPYGADRVKFLLKIVP